MTDLIPARLASPKTDSEKFEAAVSAASKHDSENTVRCAYLKFNDYSTRTYDARDIDKVTPIYIPCKIPTIFLRESYSPEEYENFLCDFDQVGLGSLFEGIIWLEDGSWIKTRHHSIEYFWIHFKMPVPPEECKGPAVKSATKIR